MNERGGVASDAVAARAKRFEFAGSVEREGHVLAEGRAPIELPEAWTPEHLLLAAVARCTLKSLAFHARGALVSGAASMTCAVTRREADGRYAVIELDVRFDVQLDPEPVLDQLPELLAKAERDCFVGNSLAVKPGYEWRVNGRPAAAAS